MAFDTQHAEWVTVSLFLFNTGFFLFYHTRTVSSDIDPAYLSLLIFFYFLTLWHPSSLFPVFPILTRSAVSGPGGAASGTFKSLFISEAILRHLVPHGQFVTMQNARRCPWGWPVVIALPDTWREKKKETARDGEKERVEQRENEPDKGPETHPSHSAEPGDYAARLSAPLISQMPPLWQCDTDY